MGEPGLLRQVWINLMANALKFTRNRGQALALRPLFQTVVRVK
ncbi:MAG: hypothetical protein AB1768_08000 [Pseudomonadota bacterium]